MSIHIESFSVPGSQASFSYTITEEETAAYSALMELSPADTQCEGIYSSMSNLFMVGKIGGILRNELSSQGFECINLHFEFLAAIQCGDTIETTIQLSNSDPDKNLATFKVDCINQAGEEVITGQAVMIMPH